MVQTLIQDAKENFLIAAFRVSSLFESHLFLLSARTRTRHVGLFSGAILLTPGLGFRVSGS